jgi:hypothetical protein
MDAQSRTGRTQGISLSFGRRLRRPARFLAAAVVAIAALGVTASSALAYGSPLPCGSRAEAPVFAPWGDTANYFLISNGGFESGSTDWSLSSGASVVYGNEPWRVRSSADRRSLQLGPGSWAESRTMCIGFGESGLRMFVKGVSASGAILHVDAIVQNSSNGWIATAAFDVNGGATAWAPSIRIEIPRLFNGSGQELLTLRFTERGTPATWLVDDVYLDPFKSW